MLLTRRRTYIMPTRFGCGYAALLLVMLLGAINYGNSMAFALTFLLSGIGFVVMHHTHANLINLRVSAHAPNPVFAGQQLQLHIELANPTRRARYALTPAWSRPAPGTQVDIPAHDSTTVILNLPSTQRGWLSVPRFVVGSAFPLGLFHAWAWVELDLRALVYPQPAGLAHPPRRGGNHGTHPHHHAGTEDFASLREYHPGDPLRLLHWKSLARLPQPMVNQFSTLLDDELWLDWDSLPRLGTEARLSQLTRWLMDAEARHGTYGLRLPGTTRAPQRGGAHRLACLRALALYGREEKQ